MLLIMITAVILNLLIPFRGWLFVKQKKFELGNKLIFSLLMSLIGIINFVYSVALITFTIKLVINLSIWFVMVL